MAKQIRGIILEGQSCAGKTSIFNAIKESHYYEKEAERNVIYLSEHYSQNLNAVHGELVSLSREENLKVLSDRLSMLEQLNQYANNMGEHSRRSRGIFFVFERFHLNYLNCFQDAATQEYQDIEKRIMDLNALTVLCVIREDHVEERLRHRAHYTKETVTKEKIEQYIETQRSLIELTKQSKVTTTILYTEDREWNLYARMLLEQID